MPSARIPWSCLGLLFCAHAALASALPSGPNRPATWVGSWATSEQIPEPNNSLAPGDMRDATLRQIVHLSIGGARLRVHLSNAFGTAPQHFTSVHIARPASAASPQIDASTDRALSFSGRPDVTIPAGAEYISDPVAFRAAPQSDLVITFHVDDPPTGETGHPGSRATSCIVHGDHVSDADLPAATRFDHWFNIGGVDVSAPPGAAAIVTLGDSITDGHGSTTNGNDRWPDDLARRLEATSATRRPRPLGVLNAGIGGNRLLLDGAGPNALARFDRDVVAQAGVRYLIVLEGINDIGMFGRREPAEPPAAHEDAVRTIIAAYEQIIFRAHAHAIRVFGGTITPFAGSAFYHPGPLGEADRQAVNQWIRAPGHFDAVIDFDKALRDPARPEQLLPAYDSGDHLHPSPAGYRAMAAAIPLTDFAK
ncbi:MAG TPA: SGNH/GDSL hydrolase family protein [Terriglobia bacterium]|nr:SGNH/GDSL hydrolase family protein [Terriglobia bacterium]